MFFTCPNCKEVFRKEMGKCPFCKYALTAEDIMNAEKEDEEKRVRAEEEIIEEHRRRNKKWIISSILFLIFLLGSIPVGLMILNSEIATVVMMIASFAIYIGFVLLSKCMGCPYCGKSLGNEMFNDYCPHCGSRLR